MLYKNICELVGNTPLLEIPKSVHGFDKVNIFVKLEYFNPFGSVKDRTAWGLIRDNIEDISVNKKIIIESSSGNTAKALVSFAGIYGTKFKTVSNRIKVEEQKEILELLGAEVKQMPGKSECPDPNDPDDPLKVISREIASNPEKYFYTDQYVNENNIKIHYETTGKEIWEDLEGKVDYFFAGLGTTGSSRGTASFIREHNADLQVIGVVSETEDFIPGIRNSSEMWEVGLYDKDFYNHVVNTNSQKSLDCMKDLISKVGVYGGPTTGSTYLGVLQYLEKNIENIKEGSNIVFIACDRFENYLSYIKKRKPNYFSSQKRDYCVYHVPENIEKEVNFINAEVLLDGNYLIIDIRNNESYKNIHIPKSINIPKEKFLDLIDNDNMPFCNSFELVIVCPYGKESKKLSAYLSMKGYKSYVLKGGMESWLDIL
ncbi:MAG: pyridoxal-phosphate dependent enzyme [Candidatus Gracilibacteria bacterium]|nr:pyridoxal-phosphate dependent enzyme [Candidatus Gracilibacteria bacterium]